MQPTFKPKNLPLRGPTNSSDMNDMFSSLSYDMQQFLTYLAQVEGQQEINIEVALAEYMATRARTHEAEARNTWDRLLKARAGEALTWVQDFRQTGSLSWGSGANAIGVDRRMRIDTVYGDAILPYNRATNHFFYHDLETDLPIQVPNLTAASTAVSESGAYKVVETDVLNAFNGINASYWKRDVWYTLENDTAEVQCYIQVDIPDSLISQSNMLVVHPFPAGLVDIVNIQYSTSTADPSAVLPGFATAGYNNAGMMRFHFAPLEITKLRVTLRQRTPMEWNGYKMFTYGLQELGLQLVEFDHTTHVSATPYLSNAVLSVIEAPSGFIFDKITDFYSAPYYSTGASPTYIYYHIYADETLVNRLWYSYDDANPSSTNVSVYPTYSTNKLYVLAAAEFDSGNNVSPVLDKFALRATTRASS